MANKKQNTVMKFARNAPTIEAVSLEMALASVYDESTGVAVASRATLSEMTHYTEKRVRTQTRRLVESGRWEVVARGNEAKVFAPVL